MLQDKEYYAFISYKREDEKWAKWLQHKLEHYKLPTSIRKTNPSLPERARPVFKDTTDLAGGVLEKAIKEALQSSKYLIVICSPRAAQSHWVCKEVQEFIDSGREEFIIPFIVDGEPNSKNYNKECFPYNLKELSGVRELLGININELGRDAAAIKVVAQMFNLHFDSLWNRYRRYSIRKNTFIFACTCCVVLILSVITIRMNYLKNEADIANKELKSKLQKQLENKVLIKEYLDTLYYVGPGLGGGIAIELMIKNRLNDAFKDEFGYELDTIIEMYKQKQEKRDSITPKYA